MSDLTDRDGRIVLLEKTVRTIPYGFLAVVFPVYLSQLGFSSFQVGVVLTVTVATSAFYTFVASLVADRIGRRKILAFFASMDAIAGAVLFLSSSWWAPVVAGIVGNMSVGAGETGPFLTLDQAILPETADLKHRTLLFSVYNLIGYGSLSAGSFLAGLPQYLSLDYRPLFLGYLLSGSVGAFLYSRLSRKVEPSPEAALGGQILSKESRPIVYRLSALFSVDAFGGGFIGSGILSYYFYSRYSLNLESLGLLFAASEIVTATSFLLSERIARRIGLIKTMVFTHIPSNILLALVAFAPTTGLAVTLLLGRQSLSQMDVAPRQSYVVSIVPEEDRTAAAGITNVSRTTAQSISPSLAGYAIASLWIGTPFVFAGILKLAYDVSLYRGFRKLKPPQEI